MPEQNNKKSVIDVFNRDIVTSAGYKYTTNAPLSSRMANLRNTEATLECVDFSGKRVIDIGCGDGTYTIELFDRGKPEYVYGADLANEAIKIAQQKKGNRKIFFEVQNVGSLSYASDSFDIAHIRGALHHVDKPVDVLREALRIAETVVVVEPNGYNPVLKLLEKFSKYHIEHKEKSYAPITLRHWISNIGGKVCARRFAGLVPFFCPDWLVKILKLIEPFVERIPLINALGCSVYIFVAKRDKTYLPGLNRLNRDSDHLLVSCTRRKNTMQAVPKLSLTLPLSPKGEREFCNYLSYFPLREGIL